MPGTSFALEPVDYVQHQLAQKAPKMKRILPFGSLLLTLACSAQDPTQTQASDTGPENKVTHMSQLGDEGLAPVMRVQGNTLLDSSGKPVVIRGIEGWFGPKSQERMHDLVDVIAAQGFNAVRLQLLTDELPKIEELIQYSHSKGMVFYLNDDHMPGVDQERFDGFLARSDVKAMVERHRHNMVIDVTIEEPDDVEDEGALERWIQAQKDSIAEVRSYGYTQPLIIGTLNHGRYLRGLLDHAAEIVESDPLKSVILNCQMYWGDYSGDFSYQGLSDYSEGDEGVREAMRDISASPYLFQVGIDAIDDGGNNAHVPFELLMIEAENYGIGTMFWQWKDPANDQDGNSLVRDQFDISTLTELGNVVINTNPASIRKTSQPVQDFPVSSVPPTLPTSTDESQALPPEDDETSSPSTEPTTPSSTEMPTTAPSTQESGAQTSNGTTTNESTTSAYEATSSALPAECAEVPVEYRGDNEGCDCPANGERSCDPDCAGAAEGPEYCGCDFCYPEEVPSDPSDETSTSDETTATSDDVTSSETTSTASIETTAEPNRSSAPGLPAECAEVPVEYLGDNEGCDCPANGEKSCDPDCAGALEGPEYCGCDFCYPE